MSTGDDYCTLTDIPIELSLLAGLGLEPAVSQPALLGFDRPDEALDGIIAAYVPPPLELLEDRACTVSDRSQPLLDKAFERRQGNTPSFHPFIPAGSLLTEDLANRTDVQLLRPGDGLLGFFVLSSAVDLVPDIALDHVASRAQEERYRFRTHDENPFPVYRLDT